jgi:hypothetical protein
MRKVRGTEKKRRWKRSGGVKEERRILPYVKKSLGSVAIVLTSGGIIYLHSTSSTNQNRQSSSLILLMSA